MESYSVEAILSAVDSGFTKTMNDAQKSMSGIDDSAQKTGTSIMDIAKGVGVFKLVDAGIGLVRDSLDGAITRYDKLSQFPKVLTALGASTEDADRATNKLKEGIDGLPTTLQDVADTTQQMYSVFKDADVAADSTLALNNALLASGADSAKAARGTEQYLKILRTGKVDMDSYTTLQETMGVGLDKLAEKFGFTGASAQSDLYKALQSGEVPISQFNQGLIDIQEGLDGTAAIARTSTEGIETSMTNLKNSIKNGLANVIQAADDGLVDAGLGSIAENFNNLKNVVNNVFKEIVAAVPSVISTITNLYNAISPFLPIIGAIIGYVLTYQTVMGTARKALELYNGVQGVFNAILVANPIGLVIAAIIALVAGFIYLWNTSEDFRNFWIGLWESIQNAVSIAVEWIQNAWSGTKEWFVNAWNGVGEFFSNLWEGITDTVSNAVESVQNAWNGVIEFFSGLWDGIKQGATDAWESLTSTVTGVFSKIIAPFEPLITWFGSLWDSISTMAGSAWEIIKTVIMGPILLLIDLVTGNFEQLKEDASMIWTTLTTNISTIVTTFISIVTGYYTAFVETVVNLWNNLTSSVTELWTTFTTWISQTVDNLVNGVVQTWENFKQSTIDLFKNTIQAAQNAWESFKTWIINLVVGLKDSAVQTWENLKQSTVDAFNNLVTGAQQAWDNLVTGISNVINSVFEWFDKLKNINLLDIGKAIIDGFVGGLKDAWESGKDFIGGIGDWIRDHKGPIQYDRKLLIPAGNAIMEGLNNGLNNGFGTVQSTVGGIGDRISDAMSTDYSLDIGANVARANRSINSEVTHQVNYGNNSQPATFNLNLGNSQFQQFIDDISNAQGREIDINLLY